ncbi:hypothetical protein GCM10023259_022350 [Thermocatellispora tengchongensis]
MDVVVSVAALVAAYMMGYVRGWKSALGWVRRRGRRGGWRLAIEVALGWWRTGRLYAVGGRGVRAVATNWGSVRDAGYRAMVGVRRGGGAG